MGCQSARRADNPWGAEAVTQAADRRVQKQSRWRSSRFLQRHVGWCISEKTRKREDFMCVCAVLLVWTSLNTASKTVSESPQGRLNNHRPQHKWIWSTTLKFPLRVQFCEAMLLMFMSVWCHKDKVTNIVYYTALLDTIFSITSFYGLLFLNNRLLLWIHF